MSKLYSGTDFDGRRRCAVAAQVNIKSPRHYAESPHPNFGMGTSHSSTVMTDTGQLFSARLALSTLSAVTSPYASAKPSSAIRKTSGHISGQRPHPMQPSRSIVAFIHQYLISKFRCGISAPVGISMPAWLHKYSHRYFKSFYPCICGNRWHPAAPGISPDRDAQLVHPTVQIPADLPVCLPAVQWRSDLHCIVPG